MPEETPAAPPPPPSNPPPAPPEDGPSIHDPESGPGAGGFTTRTDDEGKQVLTEH
jgi:hypothetical protein